MLANLSLLLEEYYRVPNEMKNRNLSVHLEEIRNYLAKQYEENLFEIYECILILFSFKYTFVTKRKYNE